VDRPQAATTFQSSSKLCRGKNRENETKSEKLGYNSGVGVYLDGRRVDF
jgi:hypothetical protein